MLEVAGVRAGYGRPDVLKGIDLRVEQGEIIALVGANGAGKTSALRAISGMLPLRAGAISLLGHPISGLAAERVVAAGLAMVPEGRHVFAPLSVAENLEMGAYLRRRAGLGRGQAEADRDAIYDIFPRLRERARQLAGTLSGGEQQMLAIGRALMGQPKVLLLDEPSMGLAPRVVSEIFAVLRRLNAAGTTILVAEQNARMALKTAHRAYVIESGQIVGSGPTAELSEDPRVRRAYLGA